MIENKKIEHQESRFLNTKQAAAFLNMPIGTVYKLTSHRRIPFSKTINRLKFDRMLLEKWIKGHTKMPINT